MSARADPACACGIAPSTAQAANAVAMRARYRHISRFPLVSSQLLLRRPIQRSVALNPDAAVTQKPLQTECGSRLAEERALHPIAARRHGREEIRAGLHAFRGDIDGKRVCQTNDRPQYHPRPRVVRGVQDELAVDLYFRERQLVELGDRAHSGAVIIERQADAGTAQPLERIDAQLAVADALG